MKTYKYILLDWDGNLARTLDIWLEACRSVVNKRGVFPTDEQIGASFGAFIDHMKEWGVEDTEKAMEQLGAVKEETVIVGDSDKDIGAANNTGLDSILFYPPEHKKFYNLEKLKTLKPTYIVDDLRKIENIIK